MLLGLVEVVVCDVSCDCDLWSVLVDRERCRCFVWIYIFWGFETNEHIITSEAIVKGLKPYLYCWPIFSIFLRSVLWLVALNCLHGFSALLIIPPLAFHKLNEDTHTHTYTPITALEFSKFLFIWNYQSEVNVSEIENTLWKSAKQWHTKSTLIYSI